MMMFLRFPGGLRKAVTLSYDDGVEQDEKLLEIVRRHGLKITFNLNSGCFPGDDVVYAPGTIHRRMPLSRCLRAYAGDGVEVASHCLTHASLTELNAAGIVREVLEDRENLEKAFGGIIRGFAYPFGTYSDAVISALRSTSVAYARTVQSTHRFDLPADFLCLHPTCHHKDPQLPALCDRFLQEEAAFASRLFYLWGHAYEFEADDNWQVMEAFAEKMGGREDIWYATNIDLADYVQAYRRLITSADGKTLYNPTAATLWFTAGRREICLGAGETITL